MFKMVGSVGADAMPGEKKVATLLQNIFDQDEREIWGYYEPLIGDLRPDFLLLSPNFGVVVIEIKDYLPQHLSQLPKTGPWKMISPSENADDSIITKDVSNPIDQIYKYWKGIENRINACHFKQSQNPPIIQIIILSNIEKYSDTGVELNKLMPQKVHCCFKDELRKDFFAEFMKSLLVKNIAMTDKQFDKLCANLIPLARLPEANQKKITDFMSEEDQIKLLDHEQQKIAFEIGEVIACFSVWQEVGKLFY